jgi:uncharacterized protein YbaR (Trm112 family)
MAIQPDLLEIVRCPKCVGKLVERTSGPGKAGLVCEACKLVYPVVDEIPNFLLEEALPLEQP